MLLFFLLGILPYFSADLESAHQNLREPTTLSVRLRGARPAPASHSCRSRVLVQAVHAQSCRALCYPVGCSLQSSPSKDSPGQGYWSGLSLRGCSWDQSHLSRASRAGRWILYHWATGNVTCWWLSFSFRFCLPVGLPSPTPPVAWSCLDSLGQVDSCEGAMQEKAITTRGHCNPYAGRTSRTDGPSTSPRRKLIALRFRFSFDSGVTLCGWISVVAVCYVIESMCALLAYCSWKKTTPFKAFPFLSDGSGSHWLLFPKAQIYSVTLFRTHHSIDSETKI